VSKTFDYVPQTGKNCVCVRVRACVREGGGELCLFVRLKTGSILSLTNTTH